jgi:hypothetical protein
VHVQVTPSGHVLGLHHEHQHPHAQEYVGFNYLVLPGYNKTKDAIVANPAVNYTIEDVFANHRLAWQAETLV